MKNQKVLIIDKERHFLLSMEARLKSEGYAVMTACDSHEAISIAREEQPNLILVDTHMKNTNGQSVATQLKLYNETSGIPILFYKSEAQATDRQEVVAKAVYEYFQRPRRSRKALERTLHRLGRQPSWSGGE